MADGWLTARAPRSYRTRYDNQIASAAQRHAIDPLLLHAIIRQESNYRSNARSHAGAIGLMQIMPGTGARFGTATTQLYDPVSNVDTGARLLRTLNARYRGNLDLMLAAYNAGEGAVARYGNRIPPFRETQDYVRKVKLHYSRLAAENGLAGLPL
nr:lytic transglycosylase domain-containing protein [Qipengyuania qiaonensis]